MRAGDRIGWTDVAESGVISFVYDYDHATSFRTYAGVYPEVGQGVGVDEGYQFDGISMPAVFSVAVKIKTGELCSKSDTKQSIAMQLKSVM